MIKLSEIPTTAPNGIDEDEAKDKLEEIADKIAELGEKMSAKQKHSLLVVFQGLDSSGKDGSTEKVF